ncbi:MAG: preprotein translocase subunit SecG [Desulfarculaceae bacterium]|nr:preprotein translocase subunit SecG [Desulfarculaceae bacterium]MCF8072312.1 preprotein translocase subunit SecG [Desulfarculaceae bacterium]MCF8100233.1 preprotein translocase subunit SecG [Desulfarculaceae bacterium]MCF8116194.1 preprotein translocase subunit SecG [Desulfarculaceae bacterium]
MSNVTLIIHLLASVVLVLVVLLQTGKGASIGAAFGGSSQTVFGSAGAATFLSKLTTVVAVVFMLTSLGLAILGHQGAPSSVMEGKAPAPASSAAAPAKPAPAPATK